MLGSLAVAVMSLRGVLAGDVFRRGVLVENHLQNQSTKNHQKLEATCRELNKNQGATWLHEENDHLNGHPKE